MFGQRLRNHTPALDTLILEKFVDIALVSPEKVFSEIVQKFDDISRQSLSPENKMVTTAVSFFNAIVTLINKCLITYLSFLLFLLFKGS